MLRNTSISAPNVGIYHMMRTLLLSVQVFAINDIQIGGFKQEIDYSEMINLTNL